MPSSIYDQSNELVGVVEDGQLVHVADSENGQTLKSWFADGVPSKEGFQDGDLIVDDPSIVDLDDPFFGLAVLDELERLGWHAAEGEDGESVVETRSLATGWTRYKGPHGGSGWKNATTGEVRYQEAEPSGNEPAADNHKVLAGGPGEAVENKTLDRARELAAQGSKIKSVLLNAIVNKVKEKFTKLEARYGRKGAFTILGAMILLTPNPIPGSTMIPIGIAEAYLRLKAFHAARSIEAPGSTGQAVRMATGASPWVSHKSKSGKTAWKNTQTGEIRYQEAMPGAGEKSAISEKSSGPAQALSELAQKNPAEAKKAVSDFLEQLLQKVKQGEVGGEQLGELFTYFTGEEPPASKFGLLSGIEAALHELIDLPKPPKEEPTSTEKAKPTKGEPLETYQPAIDALVKKFPDLLKHNPKFAKFSFWVLNGPALSEAQKQAVIDAGGSFMGKFYQKTGGAWTFPVQKSAELEKLLTQGVVNADLPEAGPEKQPKTSDPKADDVSEVKDNDAAGTLIVALKDVLQTAAAGKSFDESEAGYWKEAIEALSKSDQQKVLSEVGKKSIDEITDALAGHVETPAASASAAVHPAVAKFQETIANAKSPEDVSFAIMDAMKEKGNYEILQAYGCKTALELLNKLKGTIGESGKAVSAKPPIDLPAVAPAVHPGSSKAAKETLKHIHELAKAGGGDAAQKHELFDKLLDMKPTELSYLFTAVGASFGGIPVGKLKASGKAAAILAALIHPDHLGSLPEQKSVVSPIIGLMDAMAGHLPESGDGLIKKNLAQFNPAGQAWLYEHVFGKKPEGMHGIEILNALTNYWKTGKTEPNTAGAGVGPDGKLETQVEAKLHPAEAVKSATGHPLAKIIQEIKNDPNDEGMPPVVAAGWLKKIQAVPEADQKQIFELAGVKNLEGLQAFLTKKVGEKAEAEPHPAEAIKNAAGLSVSDMIEALKTSEGSTLAPEAAKEWLNLVSWAPDADQKKIFEMAGVTDLAGLKEFMTKEKPGATAQELSQPTASNPEDHVQNLLDAYPGITMTYPSSVTGVDKIAIKIPQDSEAGKLLQSKLAATWSNKNSNFGIQKDKAAEAAKILEDHGFEPAYWPKSADDLKAMTHVKHLGGSTGADLVRDAKGNLFARKKGASAGHLREEVAADKLYQAAGVLVAPSRIIDTPNGPVKLAKYVGGKTLNEYLSTCTAAEKKAALAQVQSGFAADALFANWDVAGQDLDNIRVGQDGKLYRIDNGGSLRYRAQGKKKDAFDGTVHELTSILDPTKNPSTAKLFAGITPEQIHGQIHALNAKRQSILAAAPPELRKVLAERLDYMVKSVPKASVAVGSAYTTSDAKGLNWWGKDPVPAAGLKAPESSLQSAEFRNYQDSDVRKSMNESDLSSVFKTYSKKVINSWSPEEKEQVKNYTGSFYGGLNKSMRNCPETLDCLSTTHKDSADQIESAIAAAGRLKPPITVWRNAGLSGQEMHDFVEVAQHALETGKGFMMPAFKSCAISPDVSMGGGDVKLEIKAKTGVWVQKVSNHPCEREFLQSHRVQYKVTGVKPAAEFPSGCQWGIHPKWIIQLEEVG